MARSARLFLGMLILAILIGGPIAYSRVHRAHLRNFQVVRPGVLYRSGQLSQDGLERILHDHGIKTVVSLRYSEINEELPPDADEEIYCRRHHIRYERIRPQRWWSAAGPPPAESALAEFFAVMDDPRNHPVLIHCFAGAHRTGAFCAAYRMEYDDWTNAEALAEMRHSGYTTLDEDRDVFDYLRTYRPRKTRPGILIMQDELTIRRPANSP